MSYLEPILLHPVRRQNFGDAVTQTCNPHLIPCLNHPQCWYKTEKAFILIIILSSSYHFFFVISIGQFYCLDVASIHQFLLPQIPT